MNKIKTRLKEVEERILKKGYYKSWFYIGRDENSEKYEIDNNLFETIEEAIHYICKTYGSQINVELTGLEIWINDLEDDDDF